MDDELVDDLAWFDGLEDIELTIGASTYELQALRRPLVARFEETTQVDRAAWHVRTSDLEGNVPNVSDLVQAAAESWTVTQVERLSFGTRYRLVCERSA